MLIMYCHRMSTKKNREKIPIYKLSSGKEMENKGLSGVFEVITYISL